MNTSTQSVASTQQITKPSQATAQAKNVLGFVPALVVQHFLKTIKQPLLLPESQRFRSVVMFADISGFTNLTEILSKIGNEGAEVIAFCINRYMELLAQGISKSGGDIFKFAGDAMIVIWPPPVVKEGDLLSESEKLTILLRQAMQSAIDTQIKLNATTILDNIKLSVKIGFGIGDINIIYVGGVFSRCEYIATGDPLNQAFESEHHATQGGEIVAPKQIYDMVNKDFEFLEIQEEHKEGHHEVSINGPFYLVKGIKGSRVQLVANAFLLLANLTGSSFEEIKPRVMSYIPAALLPFIEIDQEAWSGELRRLSIMFVNLKIDLSLAKTQEGLTKIQKVIETVQKCVYYHQGSLNKLLMDDKGSTLIVVFGLPPLSHQDDPIRAILTGFALLRELAVIDCKCSIGIATGTVYAGVIGTSGSRREYSVLGDSVNLSARLMQLACGEETKKIICCKDTAESASHKLLMKYYMMVKLKGKEFELPVYEPTLLTGDEVRNITREELFSDIKTHQNSLILDEQMLTDKLVMQKVFQKQFQMVGRAKEFKALQKIWDQFIRNIDPSGFIVIRGTFGIGKSLLVRVFLQRVLSDDSKQLSTNRQPLNIVVSSLGPTNKSYKVNGFRQILQQIFIQVAQRKHKQPDLQFFKEILPQIEVSDENYDLFKQLVGIKPNEWIHTFPPPFVKDVVRNTEQEQQQEEQTKLETTQITLLTLQLFKYCTDENAQINQHKADQNSMASSNSLNFSSLLLGPNVLILHPMIIVLEDLNLYDALSFHLVRQVLVHFQRVLFMATVRDQYSEVNFISKKHGHQDKDKDKKVGIVTQEEIFLKGIQKIEDIFDHNGYYSLDIHGLQRNQTTDELKILIKQQFNIDEFTSDRKLQQTTQENLEVAPNDMKFIEQKLNDHLIFAENKPWLWKKGISQLFYQYVYLRTSGNPNAVIYLIKNLILRNMITISNQNPTLGIIGAVLWQILDNEETITMEAPLCWVQVNGSVIDKLGCLESLLMKTASVIGDIFDIQTLSKIHPFKEQVQGDMLQKILANLESRELLEVLEVSDYNIFYRFTNPFMREVIYQRITYKLRRIAHLSVAEAIQTITHPFVQEEYRERKKLEFHWTIGEQKRNISQTPSDLVNDKFTHRAKRSIIVKEIQQILSKSNDPNIIIKKGELEKKSDKNITWAGRWIVMTSRELKYYYNMDDHTNKKEPLGALLLKNIFGLVPLNEKEQGNKDWAFQLQASSWVKKSIEMPVRKFYFAAKDEDMLEEWSIFIEFAKAKAIYDDFVANFGHIAFPLGANQNNYDQSIRVGLDLHKKINVSLDRSSNNNKLQSNISRRASKAMTIQPIAIKINNQRIMSEALVATSQQDLNNLKNMMGVFIKNSTALFYAQLFEMCVQKNDDNYKLFGSNLKIVYKYKHIFEVKQNEMPVVRQIKREPTIMLSCNDSDSDQSPSRYNIDVVFDDLPVFPPSPTKDKRRKSSIITYPLAAIKEEDEKFVEKDQRNKWLNGPKHETQETENYVSDLKNQQDSKQKNLNLMKPQLMNVSTKQIGSSNLNDSSDRHYQVIKSNNSSQSDFLPLNYDADYDINNTDRSPIKYVQSGGAKIVPDTSDKNPNPLKKEQDIVIMNKNSELDLQATAVRDCYSLKGYQFFLQKGDKVNIKKIYEENEYLKCSFRGMTGILKKSDLMYNLPTGLPNSMMIQQSSKTPKLSTKLYQQEDVDRILASVQPNKNYKSKYQY